MGMPLGPDRRRVSMSCPPLSGSEQWLSANVHKLGSGWIERAKNQCRHPSFGSNEG